MYTPSDFTYKLDKTGFQILFLGQVFQTSKINWPEEPPASEEEMMDELAKAVEGIIHKLAAEVPQEVLEWQAHWAEVVEHPVHEEKTE